MPEELSREIRKLEVRLKDYLSEEEVFTKELKRSIARLKKVNKTLEGMKQEAGQKAKGEVMNLRLQATVVLAGAMKKGSKAEHERSHLLESYGAVILALEKEFRDLLGGYL